MKNANDRIVESNFRLIEKAVASTARKEDSGLSLIKEAVKELRLYLPKNNIEKYIREYFIYGCTLIGNQYIYSKSNINNRGLKEVAANIDWSRF